MMLTAVDPRTGEKFSCQCTDDENREYSKLYINDCKHVVTTGLVEIKGGKTQLRDYCELCGEGFGPARKMDSRYTESAVTNLDALREISEYQRFLKRKDFVLTLSEKRRQESAEFYKEWGKYLKSDDWKKLRKKVLDRAHHLCEGCGENEAVEVHHLTYKRRFTEMLFDLVALCPTCHSLVHFEKNEKLRSSRFKADDEYICSQCRYSIQEKIGFSCLIYDVNSEMALRDPEYCDNGKRGYEGLK